MDSPTNNTQLPLTTNTNTNTTNTNTTTPAPKPLKYSAKHIKLLAFLKWFTDNQFPFPDIENTQHTINFLHQFIDFEIQHSHNFKIHLKSINLQLKSLQKSLPQTLHPNTHNLNHFRTAFKQFEQSKEEKKQKKNKKGKNDNITTTIEKPINKKQHIPVPESASDFVKSVIESAV